MKLSKLAEILNATLLGEDVEILDLTTDSKTTKPGDLYIARRGAKLDGHSFIAEAKKRGAVAAMVEYEVPVEISQLKVNDATLALGKIAAWKRQLFLNPVLALTGSCGKTTTKEILAAILRQSSNVFVNIKSFNNAVGLPLTLWHLQPEHRYAVVELGANHPGEIKYLTSVIKPLQAAAITNAGPCHLEGFGTVDGVAKAKAEIFSGLAADGAAVLNRDSEYFTFWQKETEGKKVLSFGFSALADVSAENLHFDNLSFPTFDLKLPNATFKIKMMLAGKHNVMNALTAAALALAVGVDPKDIKGGIEAARPVSMRQEFFLGLNGAKIIDDTYNANPTAVVAALEILIKQQQRRKIFVFGGMRELGAEAKKWHMEIGKIAKALKIDALYVCGEFAQDVAGAFGSGAQVFVSQDELVAALKMILDNNSVVLVKGSRGAAMEKVTNELR